MAFSETPADVWAVFSVENNDQLTDPMTLGQAHKWRDDYEASEDQPYGDSVAVRLAES